MKRKKMTRMVKESRNKLGQLSVNSKYSRKKKLQSKGIYSDNSPFSKKVNNG
jgi:hypothetical protein